MPDSRSVPRCMRMMPPSRPRASVVSLFQEPLQNLLRGFEQGVRRGGDPIQRVHVGRPVDMPVPCRLGPGEDLRVELSERRPPEVRHGLPCDELEQVRRPLELALEKILGDPRERGLARVERVGREVGVAEGVVPHHVAFGGDAAG